MYLIIMSATTLKSIVMHNSSVESVCVNLAGVHGSAHLKFCIFRSRKKNMIWYGVLGGKEMVNSTYKNLDKNVHLEVHTDFLLPRICFHFHSPLGFIKSAPRYLIEN